MKEVNMQLRYNSTRNNSQMYSSSECILKGLADDGGLFVTQNIDDIKFDVEKFIPMSYGEIAKVILTQFLADFSEEQINYVVDKAYNTDNFETDEIFTMKDFDGYSYLELYRGRTIAFKDAALSILPHLMKCAKDNVGEKRKIAILTATSGDTGKAALEGFRDADGIEVIVFYPFEGVSRLQLLQMLTQEGKNVNSLALRGNFDDAQTGVKEIFADKEFNELLDKEGIVLSSANSINIGRLIPQVVYYYYSYAQLVKKGKIKLGDKVNFVVPTGNFGNILAGYYAYKTGLYVNKFICSSNENNVLYDFFTNYNYNKNREFKKTISPSMDILISSNLERLVYEMCSRRDDKVISLMKELSETGIYDIPKNDIFDMFVGGYATEDEIRESIKRSYDEDGYLIDTHTATAHKVYKEYVKNSGDNSHCVLLSTASAYKFSKDVLLSLEPIKEELTDDVEYMYKLREKTSIDLPKVVDGIENRKRKEEVVLSKNEMKNKIISILKR